MPRMLANEFVYTIAASDERYNEYITPTTSPFQPFHSGHRHHPATSTTVQTGVLAQNRSYKCDSHSPPCVKSVDLSPQLQTEPQIKTQPNEQTAFCIDGKGEPAKDNKNHTSMSSVDNEEDFEGFDDNCTDASSFGDGFQHHVQVTEATGLEQKVTLKRPVEYSDYHEDSEGVVEAIEVDDDEDIEAVDGQKVLKSKQEITPDKVERGFAECNPHTPSKRKKHQSEDEAIASRTLNQQHDHVVVINSDSTTISQKQKRHQINTRFQLNFNQRRNQRKANNAATNKSSTESTSEFPVSSPSNPQQYPPRPPMLKNTLPADSFERQLATITAFNPQMTLTEKIENWCCEDELSDIDDVTLFDNEFKRIEEQRKRYIRKQKNQKSGGSDTHYNFAVFREIILNKMKNQKNQKFLTGIGADGTRLVGGTSKDINSTSASDSSKSDIDNDERPSTSAVAQQQILLRRSKLTNINIDASDSKKRYAKEFNKRNQNSTTPPATSSSEYERGRFQKSKPSGPYKQFTHGSENIHDKLICPSSSEEANSQDLPTHKQVRDHQRISQKGCETNVKSSLKSPTDTKNSKNLHCLASEEIDSVFRLHRLNREIDKPISDRIFLSQQLNFPTNNSNRGNTNTHEGLIQVHLNFHKEDKISDQIGYNKMPDIFKTPIVPPKYFANQSVTTANASLIQNCSFTTNAKTSTEQINEESSGKTTIMPVAKANVTATKVKTENMDTEPDYDGVYHQQHEFCNYLGLTGMSTATAMANAVAELAQCNLTRRSLRVLRQQQQDRKEKSAKEDREHKNSLKAKQLKECGRHLRGGHDVKLEPEESMPLNEEGTNSQSSDRTRSTPSLKNFKKNNNSRLLAPTSSTLIHSPVIEVKTEPQIKILYHIATPQKEDIDTMSFKCDKDIIKPFRETLMRHTKQKNNLVSRKLDLNQEIVSETDSDSLQSDDMISESDEFSQPHSKTLRSLHINHRRSHIRQKTLKVTLKPKIKLEYQTDQQATTPIKLEVKKTTSDNINTACVPSVDLAQLNHCPLLKSENITKDQSKEKSHNSSHEDHVDECDRSLTPTATLIKEKLQAALDESRKTKPNIYIVQSFECKKEDPTKTVPLLNPPERKKVDIEPVKEPPAYVSKVEVKKQMISGQEEIESDHNMVTVISKKKNKKKVSKALPKSKRQPTVGIKDTNERELRSQKSVPIKTSESEENPKEEIQKKSKHLKTSKSFNISLALSDAHLPKNTKSYRNVETETKDLELYNNQARTRLMAKATALLQRSRRMSTTRRLNTSNNFASKLSDKHDKNKTQAMRPKIRIMRANIDMLKKEYKIFLTSTTPPPEPKVDHIKPLTTSPSKVEIITEDGNQLTTSTSKLEIITDQYEKPKTTSLPNQENDNVVVSSTTNSCDERQHINPHLNTSPVTIRTLHNTTPSRLITKDTGTQMDKNHKQGLRYLSGTPSATHIMRNPLKKEHGVVHYLYYEVDTLIVVQERSVSFWKCSRLLSVLSSVLPASKLQKELVPHSNVISSQGTSSAQINAGVFTSGEWIMLGELHRLTYDLEVSAPYANRICLHNSTPIYVEMRARQLPKHNRSCNLLSMYINIYFYHDEDIIAKTNSIQLDTIQSDIKFVNYTTLLDSRYFIMTWPQENRLGKVRCGLCKYSLTPQLDTLASIREFKSMRHTIRYLECINELRQIEPQMLSFAASSSFRKEGNLEASKLLEKLGSSFKEFALALQACTTVDENLIHRFAIILTAINTSEAVDAKKFDEYARETAQLLVSKYGWWYMSPTVHKVLLHGGEMISYSISPLDDKLLGFSDTQLTVWDHRSGDVLMKIDLDMPLGKHLGSMYYTSQENVYNNMIILFQWRDSVPSEPPELLALACTVTHIQPSFRVLYQFALPKAFKDIKRAINTGEHLIIIGSDSDGRESELWISCGNPAIVAQVPPSGQDCKRFYNREKSQLLELTERTLNLDTVANHTLKLAAGLAINSVTTV